MIHQPEIKYSGLTIILDKPSRHDGHKLISGWAGMNFENFLNPIAREECQIRSLDCQESLLPDTKVILGLGEGCIGTLTSKEFSLNEIRGYPLTFQGRPLILSYAPQDVYDRKDYSADDVEATESEGDDSVKHHGKTRRRNWKWWLMQDIKKAKYLLTNPPIQHIKNPIITIAPSSLQLSSLQFHLQNLKDSKLFIDIETNKYKRLNCIGIGYKWNDINYIYVIPFNTWTKTLYYNVNQTYFALLQDLTVAMHNNTVVLHNSMFDLFVLCYYYKIPVPRNIFDTMLAWHRCYPELEKSIGHLLSYLSFSPYHKGEGIYNPVNPEQDRQLWNYNAKDILAMMELMVPLEKEIFNLKTSASVSFANTMVRPYLTMMFQGAKLNVPRMIERFNELQFKKEQLEVVLKAVTKRELNPRSPKQVTKYLYSDLGFDCPNEKAPTNEKTLLKLLGKHKNIPSVRIILETRGVTKLASSLKFNLYNRPSETEVNRLTTAYNLAGTDTFRLSSKALLKFGKDKGFGTNVQNWNKSLRDLVIADEGQVLIQVDQSGAEALIVAYLCANGKFRSLFIHGVKPHVFVGLHLFKDEWKKRIKEPKLIDELCALNPDQLKSHPGFKEVDDLIKSSDDWEPSERYYFIAKMICHSSNYGIRAPTFQLNVLQKSDGAVALSLQECKLFLGFYHNLFPEIEQWHCHIRKELEQTRILANLFGEARRFYEPTGDDLFKQGYAFKPQSTVGEITNRAIVSIQEDLDEGRITQLDLLQNGHDSILSQTPEGMKELTAKYIKSKLEQDLVAPDGTRFKMKAEVSIGRNWGPYKKGKNEDGMKAFAI